MWIDLEPLMCDGILFHSLGLAVEKALSLVPLMVMVVCKQDLSEAISQNCRVGGDYIPS